MRKALLCACLSLVPSLAAADAVHTPAPIEGCPRGSASAVTGMGMIHGSFAYCAPRVCSSDRGCPGPLRCREAPLQIEQRVYSTGGGHGAPPGPQEHVSFVVGPCDTPEPGIYVIPPGLGAIGDTADIEAGCRRVPVCVPASVGEPLGTTAPASSPNPDVEAPEPLPEAPEPPVADPPPVAEPVAPPSPTPAPSSSPGAPTDAGGCACGVGRHALPRRLEALVLLGLFGAIRRSRRR
ncbi:MAG: hypothetical protein H6719_25175 [Sandaracinaceae bacterium]|nr:hypothetical protein [Sandaracinaceae bacterium]